VANLRRHSLPVGKLFVSESRCVHQKSVTGYPHGALSGNVAGKIKFADRS